MFRLKQRVLPWKFDIAHMPGISNRAADAASQYPSQSHVDINLVQNLLTTEDHSEVALNKAIMHNAYELTNLSWDTISETTCSDPVLSVLYNCIREGFPPDSNSLEPSSHQFWNIRNALYITEEDVIMFCDRVVLPSSLRSKALSILQSAHQGTSAMEARAKSLLFWPGINKDIKTKRDECDVCCKNAPSQPALPAQSNPDIPTTPFKSIFADFFYESGCHYLIAGDRLSGWVEAFSSKHGSSKSGSVGLVSHLRSLFATFGVPETISSDGGPEFTASHTSDFLKRWGVKHRMSSAYFPKSNGRAEVAVKKVKRFLLSCIWPSGTLDTDNFLQGMLQLRNTPDRDCNVSPAQILFGRPLRDAFSFVNRYIKFDNPAIDKIWKEVWKSKELALRT